MNASRQTLFRHSKREEWGLGIVLKRLDDRVRMQFQDGRARTFKIGYYAMLDAVDRPLDVTMSVVRALESMTDELEKSAESRKQPVSLDEQIAYFRELFPGGFRDEDYQNHHRGDGRKRPLKRHRDAFVEKANQLSKNRMRAMLRDGQYSEIHAAASDIVNVTDLVQAKERKRFSAIEEEHHQAVAESLNALLHGKSRLSTRFDAFLRTLDTAMGKNPSWGLATVFIGGIQPNEHVVVREKVLSLQASWMAPGLAIAEHPMGLLYERLVQMTTNVREKLNEAGLEPRDNLDVTDFMWETLRPKAQKRIDEMRRERGLMMPQEPAPLVVDAQEAA